MGSDAVDAVLSRPTDQALKERVGGNAADLDWCLKLGCAAMSCHAPPVTLSRNGWAVMRRALSCLTPPIKLSRSR